MNLESLDIKVLQEYQIQIELLIGVNLLILSFPVTIILKFFKQI